MAFADGEKRIQRALDEVGLGSAFASAIRTSSPAASASAWRLPGPDPRTAILLLDEPTSALDASVQAEVLNLLEEVRRRRKLTFLMVSHDLAIITHMCERLMVMKLVPPRYQNQSSGLLNGPILRYTLERRKVRRLGHGSPWRGVS
jgi:peptide/nickel transport system ATP-binding protein